MRSKTLPPEMCALAQRLPMITVIVQDKATAYVSVAKLHRALGIKEDILAWLYQWAEEWAASVLAGTAEDVGPVVQEGGRLVLARLAIWMACNSHTDASSAVSAYLERAELRHRIQHDGALTALEVAVEFNLTDRRQNATRRIGDSIVNFAACTADVPRVLTIGPRRRRVRGFPSALLIAWFVRGGGAELIAAEKKREPIRRAAQRSTQRTSALRH